MTDEEGDLFTGARRAERDNQYTDVKTMHLTYWAGLSVVRGDGVIYVDQDTRFLEIQNLGHKYMALRLRHLRSRCKRQG